jgi:hypothetical protein
MSGYSCILAQANMLAQECIHTITCCLAYLSAAPLAPDDDAPVLPVVPELLEVPLDEGVFEPDGAEASEDEPLDDPIPDDDPDVEPVLPGDPLADPDPAAPVLPDVPELVDAPAVPPDLGAVADDPVLSDGPTRPAAEPVADPMPEVDPDAVPVPLGPEVVHAAMVKAHAKGTIHLVI